MNLLGILGAQAPAAMADLMPQSQVPSMDPINASLAANALKPKPSGGGLFHQGGTVSNILGAIGDAFLVQSGHEPVYANAMKQKRLASALSNYLGNLDPGMADIFAQDPEVGLGLYKIKHPTSEVPAALKEFEYYKGLQGGDRSSYENFLKLTHPGMISPITLGPGDTYDPGGGADTGGDVTATGPNGEKIRFNPQSGQWEPMGGATASTPSHDFR